MVYKRNIFTIDNICHIAELTSEIIIQLLIVMVLFLKINFFGFKFL